MYYDINIFEQTPARLMQIFPERLKRRRLERGLSRYSLSSLTGVPAPTIAKFETTGQISLSSFLAISIELGYYDELSGLFSAPKYRTGEELDTINKNQNRKRGR